MQQDINSQYYLFVQKLLGRGDPNGLPVPFQMEY
jgi:hypothetical protein